MNIDELLKPELTVLAKRLGIKFNSKTTKQELVDSLKTIDKERLNSKIIYLFGEKETNQVDIKKTLNIILKILGILLPLGIFTIALLNYVDRTSKVNCNNYELEKFPDSTTYNVLLFDLLDYSSCNSYEACEAEIAKRISQVNKNSHIPIIVRIEKCKSIDLGIFSLEEAKIVAEKSNSNIVIYGGIEGNIIDSLTVNLAYAANPNDIIRLKGIVEQESNFRIKSIFDISTVAKIREIEDIIYWNLATRAVEEGTKNSTIQQKKYLNLISNTNKRDYSNAKLIEGITFLYEQNLNDANEAFTESIRRDSLNSFPYYERSLLNVALGNFREATIDFQYNKVLALNKSGFIDTMNLPNIDQYREAENFPLNVLSRAVKKDNLSFGCAFLLKTLYEYNDLEIYAQSYMNYCVEKGFKEQIESILEVEITEIQERKLE